MQRLNKGRKRCGIWCIHVIVYVVKLIVIREIEVHISTCLIFQLREQSCTRFIKIIIKPVDCLSGQIHNHQEECQICTANQEHHSLNLHPRGYPRNTSFPISKGAEEPLQRNKKLQLISDHEASQWPTTLSCQHPPVNSQFSLVSMP